MTQMDEPRDERLRAALRHAPDHELAPPPLLSASILAAARRAAQAEGTGRKRPWSRPDLKSWFGAGRWPLAGAGSLAAAMLAATVLWVGRGEVPDERVDALRPASSTAASARGASAASRPPTALVEALSTTAASPQPEAAATAPALQTAPRRRAAAPPPAALPDSHSAPLPATTAAAAPDLPPLKPAPQPATPAPPAEALAVRDAAGVQAPSEPRRDAAMTHERAAAPAAPAVAPPSTLPGPATAAAGRAMAPVAAQPRAHGLLSRWTASAARGAWIWRVDDGSQGPMRAAWLEELARAIGDTPRRAAPPLAMSSQPQRELMLWAGDAFAGRIVLRDAQVWLCAPDQACDAGIADAAALQGLWDRLPR